MANEGGPVFEITLSKEQADALTPIVLQAGADGRNILFAVTIPNWNVEAGQKEWLLQAVCVPARIGHKIKRLILESAKPRAAAATTPRVEHNRKVITAAGSTKRAQNYPRAISRQPDPTPVRAGKLAKYANATRAKEEQPALL